MSTRSQERPAGPPAGPLTAGSLCSGYGGLDLAVMAVTGARLAWVAETDKYAAGVLAHHWPGVPNLGDVTALDWALVPPVDLVAAGWPCQDISYAGLGTGITKGTRSGLWIVIADGLRHLRPSYVSLHKDISDIRCCIAFRDDVADLRAVQWLAAAGNALILRVPGGKQVPAGRGRGAAA